MSRIKWLTRDENKAGEDNTLIHLHQTYPVRGKNGRWRIEADAGVMWSRTLAADLDSNFCYRLVEVDLEIEYNGSPLPDQRAGRPEPLNQMTALGQALLICERVYELPTCCEVMDCEAPLTVLLARNDDTYALCAKHALMLLAALE